MITTRYITQENAHRFFGSQRKNYVGSFGHKFNNSTYVVTALEAEDAVLIEGVQLKEGEQVFFIQTDRMKLAGLKPLVKINLDRHLVYFLVEGAEEPIFESRGVKMSYLNLLRK
jgi:hypothetical protein